jgi:predicted nucleotidyltransferase
VDPIVYGTKNCRRAYEALRTLQQDSKSMVRQYSDEELQRLYQFRSKDTQMSFGNFIQTESRKVLQGTFRNKDYFIRFVKDWKEIEEKYGQVYYKNAGYARIKAEIEDDSQAIFTPCSYQIGNVEALEGHNSNPIEEVSSFRGRFCEQARIGEVVIAQGKVEKVTDSQRNREFFRLLLGNKTSDFMILAD